MKPMIAALFSMAILAGCASSGAPHGTVSEIRLAKQAAFQCTRRGVRELDDHLLPASQMGARIAQACSSEWMEHTKLSRPIGRRTSYMVGWYHRMEAQQRAWSTQAVLIERNRQAAR